MFLITFKADLMLGRNSLVWAALLSSAYSRYLNELETSIPYFFLVQIHLAGSHHSMDTFLQSVYMPVGVTNHH